MNCLPIVLRELQVAARRRSTFWVRVAAAVTGLTIGSGFLISSSWRGISTAQMGGVLFHTLTWMCLAAGLCAGLFFTSDCLSEEKRDGTLGLLFLTDLRGYDVALGKLLATSLRGFYALLAVLPMLAITQLMGGVTGAQYWKSSLALVNALFCSLSAGLFISALSRDSQRALAATLFVLLLVALGGPLADAIIAGTRNRGFQPVWSLSSPAYVLVSASAWGRSAYWHTLLVTQLLGWVMFALACALVPHAWQDRKKADSNASGNWSYSWNYGGTRRRGSLRRKLLAGQPMVWLVCRERWQAFGLWAMAVLTAGAFAAALIAGVPTEAWFIWNYVGGLFTLILYLFAASQACRFLVEARRTGLLELLLASPLSEKEIVRGQWRALLRTFGLPVLLLLSAGVASAALSQLAFRRMAVQTAAITTSAGTNQSGVFTNRGFAVSTRVTVPLNSGTNAAPAQRGLQVGSRAQQMGMTVVAATAVALGTAGNLLALCWFGMWMGLTSRTANLATLKTILFVQVIPWFVIAFGASAVVGMMMAGVLLKGRSPPTQWLVWYPLLTAALSTTLALGKDIGFIVWSRKRLYSSFREQAARSPGQPRSVARAPSPGVSARQ